VRIGEEMRKRAEDGSASYYELLGLEGPNCSETEIKKAYRKARI
jgi:hypothetical protein